LAVSPSAVSQQIRLLEEQLGVKLFRRKGRTLSLTLEGEQLFQASATALRMLREAQGALGQRQEMRRLNLRVSPSFGVRWLGPRLAGFVHAHPDWDLRVDAAPDPTDFDREIMDLDIRYGTGAWQGYHAEPVLEDAVLPLASPDLLAGLQPGGAADVLGQCRLIDSARALCQWDFWLLRNGLEVQSNRKKVLMDRSSMALQLALDGVGVVLESLALAAPEVASGRLVPLLPALPVLRFPAYWVLCPARHLNRRVVRGFLGWLQSEAAAHETAITDILAEHRLSVERLDPQRELLRGEIE
jgi:LysR family glycine cleavage system transcriptional activator